MLVCNLIFVVFFIIFIGAIFLNSINVLKSICLKEFDYIVGDLFLNMLFIGIFLTGFIMYI